MNNIVVGDNRKYFITDMIKFNKYTSYLELGVNDGKNITYICNNTRARCVGVDISVPRFFTGFTFYKNTTDGFFNVNTETFDLVFIDACHQIDFVKTDFINSLSVLNRGGMILLHDVDPISEIYIDNTGLNYSANAYKIIDWLYINHPELNVLVLGIDETGLAVVNRNSDRRVFTYKGDDYV